MNEVLTVQLSAAASEVFPRCVSAVISPASWREGQKLVKTVLGPVPKLPTEDRPPTDGRLSRTGAVYTYHSTSLVWLLASHIAHQWSSIATIAVLRQRLSVLSFSMCLLLNRIKYLVSSPPATMYHWCEKKRDGLDLTVGCIIIHGLISCQSSPPPPCPAAGGVAELAGKTEWMSPQ